MNAYLIKNEFVKSVFSLLSGNLLAQIITLGVSPIITRLFTPDNFGTLAIFTAFVMVFSQVGSLCYERAILLPKKEVDAINILFLSFCILLITTIVVGIICFLFNQLIAEFLNNSEMSFLILFLPIGIFVSGAYKIYQFWFIRQKMFKEIGLSRMFQSIVAACIKLLSGFIIGAFSGWLVGSFIIGISTSFFYIFWLSNPFLFKSNLDKLSPKKIKKLASEFKQFPLFASWNALINFASQSMAIFMFSIYFSPTVVGLYSLANRVLRQPIITLSESIQNVYFQKSAEQTANNINIKYGFMKTTLFLVMIGFIPFTILLVFGEKLFVIIFGVDWAVAGFFVQIMTPWFFFLFLNSPGNVVFEVCKKQDLRLKINIIKGVLRFIGLFVGCAIFKDPVITLAIFIVISTVFELISLYFAFDLARANI